MSVFARKVREATVRPMMIEDIEEVREVGQQAWSDLAMHDIGRRFKYPKRSGKIIDAYLWKDPAGCMVAEEGGKIVGSAVCHVWGKIGWTGPLEVLPSYQDQGIGGKLLAACESRLMERGCSVIGLETMSHIPKNLHFYMTAGYRPGQTVLIMEKVLHREDTEFTGVTELTLDDWEGASRKIAHLSGKVHAQLDYSIDAESILRKGLGHVYLLEDEKGLQGCALLHTYQRGEEAAFSSVKAVLIDPYAPEPAATFSRLMGRCEARSLEEGKDKLLTRFPAGDLRLYQTMLSRTYLLRGANLRMIKKGEYNERGSYSITSWAG